MIINVFSSCSFIILLIMLIIPWCSQLNMKHIPNYNIFFQCEMWSSSYTVTHCSQTGALPLLFCTSPTGLRTVQDFKRCLIFSCCMTKSFHVCTSVKTFCVSEKLMISWLDMLSSLPTPFHSCSSTYRRVFWAQGQSLMNYRILSHGSRRN